MKHRKVRKRKRSQRAQYTKALEGTMRIPFGNIFPGAEIFDAELNRVQKLIGDMREGCTISPGRITRRVTNAQHEILEEQAEILVESMLRRGKEF